MTATPHASTAAHRRPAGGHVDESPAEVLRAFESAVNMSAAQLLRWLDTSDSRAVGIKEGASTESVGHRSGRRIVRLLAKKQESLTAGDLAHMRKVTGYVRRHLAQRPAGDVSATPWRYSLMNWGHDPLHR